MSWLMCSNCGFEYFGKPDEQVPPHGSPSPWNEGCAGGGKPPRRGSCPRDTNGDGDCHVCKGRPERCPVKNTAS